LLTHSITFEPDNNPESLGEIGVHDIADITAFAHIMNIHDFDDTNPDCLKPKNILAFRHKLLFTLLCSIILHMLVFYLINLGVQKQAFKKDVVDHIIVQAKLYTPPLLMLTSQQVQLEAVESETKAVSEVEGPNVLEEKKDTIKMHKIKDPKEVLPKNTQATLPIIEAPNIPTLELPAPPIKSIFDSRANIHVRRLDQGKQISMSRQEFKEYHYNKTHPEIKGAPKNMLTAEEQPRKSIEREVDCKTTRGKVLNIISGLTYGTGIGNGPVKCGKYREIKSFIKKRLEGSNSLPPS
jgi:hypothetical protein